MAFKLVIEDSIDVPVNVDINSGAKRRNFFFHLKARRMDVQTWQGRCAWPATVRRLRAASPRTA